MKKLISWIKGLFSKIERLKNKLIPVAVDVVQAVKKAINNGSLDILSDLLVMILPPTGDLAVYSVKKFLEKNIPELCVQLEIINAVNLSDKTEEAIKQALDALAETYGDKWNEFMSGLSGKLAEFLSDGEIDWKEGKELGSDYYNKYIKNGTTI